jgi:hypothetical protein
VDNATKDDLRTKGSIAALLGVNVRTYPPWDARLEVKQEHLRQGLQALFADRLSAPEVIARLQIESLTPQETLRPAAVRKKVHCLYASDQLGVLVTMASAGHARDHLYQLVAERCADHSEVVFLDMPGVTLEDMPTCKRQAKLRRLRCPSKASVETNAYGSGTIRQRQ